MRTRLLLLRHDALRALEKAVDAVWFKLPARWRNALAAKTMGYLTVADERLHSRTVPEITVSELMDAMKVDEGGRDVHHHHFMSRALRGFA